MKRILLFFPLVAFLVIAIYFIDQNKRERKVQSYGMPEPGEEENEEEEHRKRALWFELIHKAAPGTDWRTIERQNQEQILNEIRNKNANRLFDVQDESFANGQLTGEWIERGSENQAGRHIEGEFDPETNNYYALSNNTTLWMKNLTAGGWSVLSKVRFGRNILKIVRKTDGTKRLILAYNNQLVYTDDQGQTLSQTFLGVNNPLSMTVLDDANQSIYCLAGDGIYISTNRGLSFTRFFTVSSGDGSMVSLHKTHNTNELYFMDTRFATGIRLYSITGTTVTLLNTGTGAETTSKCIMRSVNSGGTTTWYALINNTKFYKSTNAGATWTLQGTVASSVTMQVSIDDPQKVFVGGFAEAFRSLNGGQTWTLVNSWGEYYGNPATKLHADILNIYTYRKTDGNAIYFINTDGGTYISNDNILTVSNISLTTLRNSEYYDVLTDQEIPEVVYAGSQDQGLQRNTSAVTQTGVLNFDQIISGDYTQMVYNGRGIRHFWSQYIGARVYYAHNSVGGGGLIWQMPGSQLPNYGWTMPLANLYGSNPDEILIGGGDLSGGSGSYIMKLSPSTKSPFTITPSQYNYNFRTASNSGGAGVTAIETVKADSNRIYVATEDGTFFYSTNGGQSWNKSASFSGPGPAFLYGSSIYASRLTPNLLWYGGTGYSNSPVYRSTNGGQSFTDIKLGLPSTYIYELVANPTETMLFAATEAGPYVYIMADGRWYPMMGVGNNPTYSYTTVQYIEELNVVRFGTYQRGIWDFKITNAAPPRPTVSAMGGYGLCSGGNTTLLSSWPGTNQWYLEGVVIPGATGSSYESAQAGNYSVVAIGNGLNSLPSSSFTLVPANPPPPPTINAGGPSVFCAGGSVVLNADAQSNGGGNAVQLDGINDYVVLPHDPAMNPTARITIETWIKANNIHGTRYVEIYRKEKGGTRHLFSFQEFGTVLSFGLEIGGVYTELDVAVNAGNYEGQWVHVAATYDGSAKRIYRNGQLIGTQAVVGTIGNPSPASGFIGSLDGGGEFFDGTVDEFRIWNVALTQQDIQAYMGKSVSVKTAGLVAYLKFDEGSGVATTNVVNGRKAFLANGASWVLPSALPLNPVAEYLWYRDGNLITGANANSYTANQAGSYTLKTVSGFGCVSVASSPIVVTVNPLPSKPTITQTGNELQSSSTTGNQWFLNGVAVTGATGVSFTPTVSGNYSVQVTASNCVGPMSDIFNFTVTAVNDPVLVSELKIFPTPVNSTLFITSSNATKKHTIIMYDIKGRQVHTGSFVKNYEIKMGGMAAGSYVVKIQSEKGNERLQRMIIKE